MINNDERDGNRSKARATAQSSLGWVGKVLVSCYNISLSCVSSCNSQRFELTFIIFFSLHFIDQTESCGRGHTNSTLDEPLHICHTFFFFCNSLKHDDRRTYRSEIIHNPHALWMYMFRSMYITTLHCCSFCLAHFLRSSICSTSLDSSTTLPLTIVCVTTFTIFRVLTSGSSAKESKQVTLLGRQNTFIFYSILFFHFTTYRAKDIHSFLLSQMHTGIQENKVTCTYFWEAEELLSPCLKRYKSDMKYWPNGFENFVNMNAQMTHR